MTGPAADGDDRVLYVRPDTLARLEAQGRLITLPRGDGNVVSFAENDPLYPGRTVRASEEVMMDTVHARRWIAQEQRYIFIMAGEV